MSELTTPADRRELLDYLSRINLGDPRSLEAKANEIVQSIRSAMADYLRSSRSGVRYYDNALRRVYAARSCRDFERGFGEALGELKSSLRIDLASIG